MKCHHVTPHHHSLATIYQHISKINNSLVRLHNRCIGTAHHVRPFIVHRFEPTGVYMSSQQPTSSPLSSPSSTQQGTYYSVCHHTLTDTVPTPAAVVSSSEPKTTLVSDQQQCKSESILHWTTA